LEIEHGEINCIALIEITGRGENCFGKDRLEGRRRPVCYAACGRKMGLRLEGKGEKRGVFNGFPVPANAMEAEKASVPVLAGGRGK